jgi:hypothetical protein
MGSESGNRQANAPLSHGQLPIAPDPYRPEFSQFILPEGEFRFPHPT